MAAGSPINLTIANVMVPGGQLLFQQTVPFTQGMTVRNVMEQAFLMSQSAATPDPFEYTVTYYGQSQSGFGFLGYEVESLCHLPNNAQNFWELFVNGVASQTGEDTTYPPAGSNVNWSYTAITAHPAKAKTRVHEVHSRRMERHSKRA